jgi:hypothetical protein
MARRPPSFHLGATGGIIVGRRQVFAHGQHWLCREFADLDLTPARLGIISQL